MKVDRLQFMHNFFLVVIHLMGRSEGDGDRE